MVHTIDEQRLAPAAKQAISARQAFGRAHFTSRRTTAARRWGRWHRGSWLVAALGCAAAAMLPLAATAADADAPKASAESKPEPAPESAPKTGAESKSGTKSNDDAKKWRSLFDGKSLKGWKVTDFPGHGDVYADDGKLILRFGELLTGITWAGKRSELPTSNYEISLQAQRVDGSDFFCGLTFPIGTEHASLIVGGWGGTLVGISSIDGYDAAENLTTTFERLDNQKWYPIRVRVTDEKLQAWIGDRRLVDVDRENREFSVRWEVEESQPLGIATYQTTGAIKDFKLRTLDEAELKEEDAGE